jgi:hypothetical protein
VSESLRGDLRHFFPAEILQLLSLAQASGRLDLERPAERAEIFVERGQPVFARTTGPTVKVGQLLVHRGAVSAETLDGVLRSAPASPGERIGSRLVSAGVATADDVQGAVRETLRRVLYGLLLWREGAFTFQPGEKAIGEDIHLDLDLDRLILEGLRQADESRRGS